MNVCKYWQSLHFWVSYSFKENNNKKNLSPNMTVNSKLVSVVFFQVLLQQDDCQNVVQLSAKEYRKLKQEEKNK